MLVTVDDDLRVNDAIAIPRAELNWRFSRSGGPGGQSVNTTDSRVELSFDVAATEALPEHLRDRALQRLANRLVNGVLTVTASEERSQLQNRRAAELRLVSIIAAAVAPPPKPRRATRPSKGSVERRLDGKRRRSQTKRDRRPPQE
jgi:ribosome-associated protein